VSLASRPCGVFSSFQFTIRLHQETSIGRATMTQKRITIAMQTSGQAAMDGGLRPPLCYPVREIRTEESFLSRLALYGQAASVRRLRGSLRMTGPERLRSLDLIGRALIELRNWVPWIPNFYATPECTCGCTPLVLRTRLILAEISCWRVCTLWMPHGQTSLSASPTEVYDVRKLGVANV